MIGSLPLLVIKLPHLEGMADPCPQTEEEKSIQATGEAPTTEGEVRAAVTRNLAVAEGTALHELSPSREALSRPPASKAGLGRIVVDLPSYLLTCSRRFFALLLCDVSLKMEGSGM